MPDKGTGIYVVLCTAHDALDSGVTCPEVHAGADCESIGADCDYVNADP